jgi:hypothetical protein
MTRSHSQRRWFPALCLLALASAVGAQDGDAKQELQAMQQELEAELKELRQATKSLEAEAAMELYQEFFTTVVPEFCQRFATLARANAGSEVAYDCWATVLRHGQRAGQSAEVGACLKEALETLTRDHLASPRLGELVMDLRYGAQSFGEDAALAALEKIGKNSPVREVRAQAEIARASVLGEDRKVGDARLVQAREVLLGVQKEFADLTPKGGESYAKQAEKLLFALENLAIGAPCPDFTAVDAEGISFKLSDYRGKVVLIDFWGFW